MSNIKVGDWVMSQTEPDIISKVRAVTPDIIETGYNRYYPTFTGLKVVTRLPRPKLSCKELVTWLKAQTGWYIEVTVNSVSVTCAETLHYYDAKTLSGAIRKLQKAMGVE